MKSPVLSDKKWSNPHKFDANCSGCRSAKRLKDDCWWDHQYNVDIGGIFKVTHKGEVFYCLNPKESDE